MNFKVRRIASLAIGGIGIALVAMMVYTEGEPGLLPLVLVLAGVIGYVTARPPRRTQSTRPGRPRSRP